MKFEKAMTTAEMKRKLAMAMSLMGEVKGEILRSERQYRAGQASETNGKKIVVLNDVIEWEKMFEKFYNAGMYYFTAKNAWYYGVEFIISTVTKRRFEMLMSKMVREGSKNFMINGKVYQLRLVQTNPFNKYSLTKINS